MSAATAPARGGPAYYNEIDPYAAEWLRNLIAAGHIAPGEVDTRSVVDVRPSDLDGFAQCHFFAGIGAWSYALRLAGWPDERPVWTGSCPCQPFSTAGRGTGTADERHLWPAWFQLIAECRPATVFGEQVETAVRHGWLDAVFSDLERAGYACGAVVLGAHSVGAPHIRQRLWFVADAEGGKRRSSERLREREASLQRRELSSGGHGSTYVMAEPPRERSSRRQGAAGIAGRLGSEAGGASRGMDNGVGNGREAVGIRHNSGHVGIEPRAAGEDGFWFDADWLPCRDGKARPVEPGLFPLAHGAPARVGRLRAYGNAIVPQVAAEVISAFIGGATP